MGFNFASVGEYKYIFKRIFSLLIVFFEIESVTEVDLLNHSYSLLTQQCCRNYTALLMPAATAYIFVQCAYHQCYVTRIALTFLYYPKALWQDSKLPSLK